MKMKSMGCNGWGTTVQFTRFSEQEQLLGDYRPGRFAWALQNPVMFDNPIPARGFQGWWNWKEN